MSKIKVGDVVEIFQKPFTAKQPEGKATIKKINREYEAYIDAEVEFVDEIGSIYFRAIAI